MVSHSSIPPKSSAAHRALGVPVQEELLNLSSAARSRLYVTSSGGIGNVNTPDSTNQNPHRGSLNPLSPGNVLKLPWKKNKRVPVKGSLYISPSSPESSQSDCATWQSTTDSRSDENHSSISSTGAHSSRILDAVSLWNLKTPSESKFPPPVQPFSPPPAVPLRNHQSMEIIKANSDLGPSGSRSPLCSPSAYNASSSLRSLSIPPSHEQTSSGQFGERISSKPRDDGLRGPGFHPDYFSQSAQSTEASTATTQSKDTLWDAQPEKSLTNIRFADHLANVKIAEAQTMRNLLSPSPHLRQNGPGPKLNGSCPSRAMSVDISSRLKPSGSLKKYPDPPAKAQFPALVSRSDEAGPPVRVNEVVPRASVAKRSQSQDAPSRSPLSLIHNLDGAGGWSSLRSSLDVNNGPPSNAPVSFSDLVVDPDGFLVVMSPASRSATPQTEKKASVDEGRTPINSSPPTSPMKYLDLINSAAVSAGTKARGRRRTQVEGITTENASETGHNATSHTRMNSSCSLESSCCSHDSNASSGGVDHKSYPSGSSATSSMRSSVGGKEEERPSPPNRRSSTDQLSPTEDMSDSLELEDELEGVKLMIGSRAVCPKFPLQHLQYRQLQPQLRQPLLPPILLTPSSPSTNKESQQQTSNNSSLGQILGFYQHGSTTGSQSSTDLNPPGEIGTAM
ncbi:hypothetical protein PGT21_006268 [Puccinia graminis f. sp. tritici]|uniref:Uncharacterized protein n=2 Tax=Puccinia graminis f. sp. tritici TaxID=56615 RepID=E3JZ30_PUCGT|nr:uncharacterized protein PGTG_03261 [Puccinia graminis f. sp. tritici CRL 75-36-700-3]EFP77305.2 hypothetical protein PGTG_03261 [Puccinia graminis f. sp. tritici CRL 75-36-700-3]KAA1114363.1 hypothetical protein PGT21_006268 [Puccinia graminis f. sp. tritici]